jgi:general secretion pathway protein A
MTEDVSRMVEEYFGFTRRPFSIVPDPYFYYLSTGHREALAHLFYGIRGDGGFVLLTGDVGTGKTTACRRLIDLLPEDSEVAFILNPRLTVNELLATICDEFGIDYPVKNKSNKVFVSLINDYLLDLQAKGRRAILIIEEAQNLRHEVLEQIRLLTNLETKDHKLLQVLMIGQPELRKLLSQPRLLQLSQRITARYHLGPLSNGEIHEYINYRLSAAGWSRGPLFSPPVMRRLSRLSHGIPRLLNAICDRALLGAYVQGKTQVDKKTLITAAREVSGRKLRTNSRSVVYQTTLAASFFVFLVILGVTFYDYSSRSSAGLFSRSRMEIPIPDPGHVTEEKNSLKIPVGYSREEIKQAAYRALFRQWHLKYKPGDVCRQAQAQGLWCLEGKGGIANLRLMNKPAVLKLSDEKEGDYYATLTAWQGDKATFSIGKEMRGVSAKEIIQWWTGEFLLFWRPPVDYGKLQPGARGPMVAWLGKQLSLAQGRVLQTEAEEVYNEKMVKEVKKFQLAHGLVPDGIVGPKTIILLSGATGDGGPVLSAGKGGT